MTRPYYTLVQRIDGTWSPQFGDHDRDVVEAERDEYLADGAIKRRDLRIIRTSSARQREIDDAIAKLNQ